MTIDEPTKLELWLHENAPITRMSVAPNAKFIHAVPPDVFYVAIQGKDACRLVAWSLLEPIVDFAVTRDSILTLKPESEVKVARWLAFVKEDHSALPADKVPDPFTP